MISGMSFVSSIVVDMSDSNYALHQWLLEHWGRAALTNDILTDCASACDSDSFVLGKSVKGWGRTTSGSHVAGAFP